MNKLKVLHVCFSDKFGGGAATACWRIHESLLELGVDSKLLVWNSKVNRKDILIKGSTKRSKLWFSFINWISMRIIKLMKTNNNVLHSINRFGLLSYKDLNRFDVDVIHLHWTNFELIKIEDLKYINKPIVIHLHDLWHILGAEHYPDKNNDARIDMEYSKDSRSQIEKGVDINRWVYLRKKNNYKDINVNIISTTSWVDSYAGRSKLFLSKNKTIIPYPINRKQFKPIDIIEARKILNLPLDKKIILFGAIAATSDKRKGFEVLIEALRIYKKKYAINQEAEIVVFGSYKPIKPLDVNLNIHYAGHVYDEFTLSLYYSAADVFVNPTLMEAFGQTTLESICCGTPVVAFDYSGTKDIISHKVNGYLAKPFRAEDFANGIEYCLNNSNTDNLKNGCENRAEQFDSKLIARKHLNYYNSILLKK